MTWLEQELDAATGAVKLAHIERLVACGVPMMSIARLGMEQPQFGVARIRELPCGLYEPDQDGTPVVIVPVIERGGMLGDMGLVDLVAFSTCTPSRWLWRIGQGWALGVHHLSGDFPVEVVRTPLEWLAKAGEAFTVLDWAAPRQCWQAVRHGPNLILPDEHTRRAMHNAVLAASIPLNMEVRHAA